MDILHIRKLNFRILDFKRKEYAYEKAVALFNEAVNMNNEARNLKGLQKATDYF